MLRRSRLLGEGRQPSLDIKRLVSLKTTLQISQVDAAQIASSDLTLDKECILERSRVVSIAPSRMPYIGLYGKYNKRWYVDVVALPHNSIRNLLSNTFELLSAVHRLVLDMTNRDFQKVFDFLAHFQSFVRVLFDAEEKIMYPEVESALKRDDNYESHPLHPNTRARTKLAIYNSFDNLTADSFLVTPSMQVVNTLQTTMDNVSRQILDYFASKELHLPRVIAKSIRGPKEKNRLEGRLIKYFGDLNQQMYYTALLISPLVLPAVRTDFEERHFPKDKREELRAATVKLEHTLFAIPKLFAEAAAKYESRFGMESFLKNYGQDRDANATTQLIG